MKVTSKLLYAGVEVKRSHVESLRQISPCQRNPAATEENVNCLTDNCMMEDIKIYAYATSTKICTVTKKRKE